MGGDNRLNRSFGGSNSNTGSHNDRLNTSVDSRLNAKFGKSPISTPKAAEIRKTDKTLVDYPSDDDDDDEDEDRLKIIEDPSTEEESEKSGKKEAEKEKEEKATEKAKETEIEKTISTGDQSNKVELEKIKKTEEE